MGAPPSMWPKPAGAPLRLLLWHLGFIFVDFRKKDGDFLFFFSKLGCQFVQHSLVLFQDC